MRSSSLRMRWSKKSRCQRTPYRREVIRFQAETTACMVSSTGKRNNPWTWSGITRKRTGWQRPMLSYARHSSQRRGATSERASTFRFRAFAWMVMKYRESARNGRPCGSVFRTGRSGRAVGASLPRMVHGRDVSTKRPRDGRAVGASLPCLVGVPFIANPTAWSRRRCRGRKRRASRRGTPPRRGCRGSGRRRPFPRRSRDENRRRRSSPGRRCSGSGT